MLLFGLFWRSDISVSMVVVNLPDKPATNDKSLSMWFYQCVIGTEFKFPPSVVGILLL